MHQIAKFAAVVSMIFIVFFGSTAHAYYVQGCSDNEYKKYIEGRFAYFEARNRRSLESTWRDYELSLSSSNNLYSVIANLSRHLKYSAQFEPIDTVTTKIKRVFEHANELSIDQQIAGDVFDSFSSETHSVGIARAWMAYRQGKHQVAFDELLKSIDLTDSALLGAFGPDFDFVRHIYRDGHVGPVLIYLAKTEKFWTGKRADAQREVWRKMIQANCQIQFDSVDTLKAVELGLNPGSLSLN